jgi:hypothetical protein
VSFCNGHLMVYLVKPEAGVNLQIIWKYNNRLLSISNESGNKVRGLLLMTTVRLLTALFWVAACQVVNAVTRSHLDIHFHCDNR